MSERLDRISYSRKVKNKFSNFIGENSTDIIAIERIVKFANKHFIMLSTSLEEYERKEIKKSRVLWANAYRLCCLVSALRFFMSSVFSNETMITIMCDGNYLVTNQRILSMIISLACSVILFICVLIQFNEINYKWYLLTFLYQLEHRQLIPLNTKNKRKLAIIINLMVKLLMKQAFWPLVTFASLLFCGPPLVAYFDNKYNFSIILVIFFTICIIVWSLQYFCIVCAGFVAWTVPFFYLKFKFNEIYETIEFCVKHNNIDVLKRVISQHNRLAIQTKLIDDVFMFVVFILYYVGSPALMLMLYLSHAKESSYLSRPIFIFIVSIVSFVVLYLNLICAQISHSAEKPRKFMFKYLIQHDINIEDRIKIMQFIEKLSGPDIGFHCWNLFPMNNYTFYQYIANCACTYFLILNLVEGFN